MREEILQLNIDKSTQIEALVKLTEMKGMLVKK